MTQRILSFVREMLFENVGLKLISLLCALVFFVVILAAERAQHRFDVSCSGAVPP